MEKKLRFYLKSLIHNGGSDLHLKSGSNVRIRVNGDLLKLRIIITNEELDSIAKDILIQKQYSNLVTHKGVRLSYFLDEN